MSRIVCFADSGSVANTVQQQLGAHDLHVLSASRLTADVRDMVTRFAPEVVVLELSRALDNAHLFFLLRADEQTRTTPVIIISPTDFISYQAAILGADAVLPRATLAEQLGQTITQWLPRERALAA